MRRAQREANGFWNGGAKAHDDRYTSMRRYSLSLLVRRVADSLAFVSRILQLVLLMLDRTLNASLQACYRKPPARKLISRPQFCYIWLRHFHLGLIWRVCLFCALFVSVRWYKRGGLVGMVILVLSGLWAWKSWR